MAAADVIRGYLDKAPRVLVEVSGYEDGLLSRKLFPMLVDDLLVRENVFVFVPVVSDPRPHGGRIADAHIDGDDLEIALHGGGEDLVVRLSYPYDPEQLAMLDRWDAEKDASGILTALEGYATSLESSPPHLEEKASPKRFKVIGIVQAPDGGGLVVVGAIAASFSTAEAEVVPLFGYDPIADRERERVSRVAAGGRGLGDLFAYLLGQTGQKEISFVGPFDVIATTARKAAIKYLVGIYAGTFYVRS